MVDDLLHGRRRSPPIARWSAGRTGAQALVLVFLGYRMWAFPHRQIINYWPLAKTAVPVAARLTGEALAAGTAVDSAWARGVLGTFVRDTILAPLNGATHFE